MTTLATRPARPAPGPGRVAAVGSRSPWPPPLVLLLAVLASFALGSRALAVDEVWRALVAPDGGEAATIVRELRMPRTALGLAVGLALAVAGVLFQALTRNPLAEPRILGISAGASFGVVLAISVFGVSTLAGYVWFGIAGALGAGVLVFAVAAAAARAPARSPSRWSARPSTPALASVVYALLSMDARTFEEYRFWVVGGLTGRDLAVAAQVVPFVLAGLVLAALVARGLDALALGDDVARGPRAPDRAGPPRRRRRRGAAHRGGRRRRRADRVRRARGAAPGPRPGRRRPPLDPRGLGAARARAAARRRRRRPARRAAR